MTRPLSDRPCARMTLPLSVCVLARDEAEELERCLSSVAFADDIVVVVDDRSEDESEAVARRFARRNASPIVAGRVNSSSRISLQRKLGLLRQDAATTATAPRSGTRNSFSPMESALG